MGKLSHGGWGWTSTSFMLSASSYNTFSGAWICSQTAKVNCSKELPPEGVCTLFFFETVWWRRSTRPSSCSEFWCSSLPHHCRVWVWYWRSQQWSLLVSACWQDPAGSAQGRQSQMYWRLSSRQRRVVCQSQEWGRGWWCRARGPHDWVAAERKGYWTAAVCQVIQ